MAYLIVAIVVASTAACYAVAKRKGLNVSLWIVIAALIGPLAIPLVYLARDRSAPAPD
ncbi:MAG: hypothetical protein RIC56_11760 [Pseudomonadales bacterium]